MISKNREGSTQGYPTVSVEVLQNIRVISFTMKMEILLEPTSNKLMVASDTSIDFQIDFSIQSERLRLAGSLIPCCFETLCNEVLKSKNFRHSDTKRLSRSDEVLKLKNFKKDAALKLFKSTKQERYEHVGPEVTNSQDG
ncbi:hypothetical protein Tco_0971739 [Tanacetum coccineum]